MTCTAADREAGHDGRHGQRQLDAPQDLRLGHALAAAGLDERHDRRRVMPEKVLTRMGGTASTTMAMTVG